MKGTNLISRLRRRGDQGLTLIELLIVITILAILAGITILTVGPFRGKSEAAAAATDADILRTAQQSYCAKTGTYASRARDLYTPPNDVLERKPGYTGTTKWPTPETASLLTYDFSVLTVPDDTAKDLYLGYRAGGAASAIDGPISCGNTGYVVGPTTVAGATTTGPQLVGADDALPMLDFLSTSYAARFGNIHPLNPGVDHLNGLLAGTTPALPGESLIVFPPTAAIPSGTNFFPPSQIASAPLVLMACRAGGLAVPTDNICKSPSLVEGPDLFNAGDNTSVTMAVLAAELDGHPDCTAGPLLVTEPTGTPYGDAAAAALTTAGFGGTTGAGCILTSADLVTAQTLFRSGGTSGHPAKWALLPNSISTDPTGIDTNWTVRIATGLKIYAAVLKPPVGGDLSGQVPAIRFINYMLSPLGQAVLQAYGYGPVATPGSGESLPVPERTP